MRTSTFRGDDETKGEQDVYAPVYHKTFGWVLIRSRGDRRPDLLLRLAEFSVGGAAIEQRYGVLVGGRVGHVDDAIAFIYCTGMVAKIVESGTQGHRCGHETRVEFECRIELAYCEAVFIACVEFSTVVVQRRGLGLKRILGLGSWERAGYLGLG